MPNWKRTALFLGGCIGSRTALTLLARAKPEVAQKYWYLALFPVTGWLWIKFIQPRDTGIETFGEPIWWQELRMYHAALWTIFAIAAKDGREDAWLALAADTTLGLGAWMQHRGLEA